MAFAAAQSNVGASAMKTSSAAEAGETVTRQRRVSPATMRSTPASVPPVTERAPSCVSLPWSVAPLNPSASARLKRSSKTMSPAPSWVAGASTSSALSGPCSGADSWFRLRARVRSTRADPPSRRSGRGWVAVPRQTY